MPSVLLRRTGTLVALWWTLVSQELAIRYRGTLLGRIWPLLLPLLMLALYGFVFGVVFRARWPGLAGDDHMGFTLNLFAGLLVHGVFAETIGQAPGLMQRHSNFIRKMVFPLPVLVAVPLGTSLFNAAFGFVLLFCANGFLGSGWHLTVLALPVLLLPYLLMLYGLALLLAALGVYIRDLGQVVGMMVMVVLFTAPVFFPADMVPSALAGVVRFNPIAWPVDAVRAVVLRGELFDPMAWIGYLAVALLVFALGRTAFALLRRGFADLL